MPLEINVYGNKSILKSIIMQPEGKPRMFIGVCPDGKFRKFKDSVVIIIILNASLSTISVFICDLFVWLQFFQISTISPGTIFDPEFTRRKKLTLIFEEKKEKQLQLKVRCFLKITRMY